MTPTGGGRPRVATDKACCDGLTLVQVTGGDVAFNTSYVHRDQRATPRWCKLV